MFRPSFTNSFAPLRTEGAGNAGCALHPRSRVPKIAHLAHTSIQGSGNTPTSPAQWLYGLLRALPGERALLPPSLAENSTSLTPASRRQDHTTSPYAFVHPSARFCLSMILIGKPESTFPGSCCTRLNKSVHRISSQRTVTTADAPLRDETASFILLIYRNEKRNIFNFGA